MADRIIEILTPATSYDLLTLGELKTSFGVATADTSKDAQFSMWITRFSDVISTYCNRIFAYEEVKETWREFTDNRVFLSHWPITLADIQMIECPSGTTIDPSTYDIEEGSGKIEFWDSTFGQSDDMPIIVTYSGGFNLPDEAPPALKQATELLIRIEWLLTQSLLRGGVRSLSHKEKRVMYYDPLATLLARTGAAKGIPSAVDSLLKHYMRFEV
jgi:hypothetical protein